MLWSADQCALHMLQCWPVFFPVPFLVLANVFLGAGQCIKIHKTLKHMGIQWGTVNVILGQWNYLCENIWMLLQTTQKTCPFGTMTRIYLLTCEGVAISAYYYQSSLHIHYGGDVFIALVFRSISSVVLLRSWFVLPWLDLYCVANIKLEPYIFKLWISPTPTGAVISNVWV